MNNGNGKTFQEQWTFPSEVKRQLGAASFEVRPIPEHFKSGRPKVEVIFLDASKRLVSRRIGMELVSKRTGTKYYVCEAEEPSHLRIKPRPAPVAQSGGGYTLDDLFDDEIPPPLPLRRETTADYQSKYQLQ